MNNIFELVFNHNSIKNDDYLSNAFEIINSRRINVLKHSYNTHKHHIIPKSVFRFLNLAVDNSKDNLVELTISEHIQVHYFYMKYFSKHQLENRLMRFLYEINAKAIDFILKGYKNDNFNIKDISLQIEESTSNLTKIQSYRSKAMWKNNYKKMVAAITKGQTNDSKLKRSTAMKVFWESDNGQKQKELSKIYNSEKWNDKVRLESANKKRKKFYENNPQKLIDRGISGHKTFENNRDIVDRRNKINSIIMKNKWKSMSEDERKHRSELASQSAHRIFYYTIDGGIRKEIGFIKDVMVFLYGNDYSNHSEKSVSEGIRLFCVGKAKSAFGHKWKKELK